MPLLSEFWNQFYLALMVLAEQTVRQMRVEHEYRLNLNLAGIWRERKQMWKQLWTALLPYHKTVKIPRLLEVDGVIA